MSFTDKFGERMHLKIVTVQIKNSRCYRLLGVGMDCKLSFENHINQICTDLRAKTKTRAKLAPFLNKRK